MRYPGLPAAPGIGCGPVRVWPLAAVGNQPGLTAGAAGAGEPQPTDAVPAEIELQRFQVARARARQELATLAGRAEAALGLAAADILVAQSALVDDPALVDGVCRAIAQGELAAAAIFNVAGGWAEQLRRLPDTYLQQRAADVDDVAARLVAALPAQTGGGGDGAGTATVAPDAGGALRAKDSQITPVVVVAPDLWPSQVLGLSSDLVAGLVTGGGSPLSHAAQLARAAGIPMVVGVGDAIAALRDGQWVALDGDAGLVVAAVGPDELELADLRARAQMRMQMRSSVAAMAPGQAVVSIAGGPTVHLMANIGGPGEVAAAIRAGATGIGLFRTEYLCLARQGMPGLSEQEQTYRQVLAQCAPRPVTIRLLDLGADKALPGHGLPGDGLPDPGVPGQGPRAEENPALGRRGIRLLLERPEWLDLQLEALLRASPAGCLQVLIPMVTVAAEVAAVQVRLAEIRARLLAAGVPVAGLRLGAMIEVPAAALAVDALAPHVEFLSIGTNDLMQYALAADRTNLAVCTAAAWRHPGLGRLIAAAVQGAQRAGLPVAVCGDLAADPAAGLALVGLGITELSMSPPAIPRQHATLAATTSGVAQAAAREWLQDASDIR